ncbi:ribose-5-phosphate isomerase RpiA [Thermogladius sp. 4427co]|uniref:ribose-5-phosphate isomerase RpiA n=1 Tax=Thermogladius sp. 4427co TaxID=3450718 RepID=UPI003F793BE6
MSTELAKLRAAGRAVEILLSSRYNIVGVGTGSTVGFFIEELYKKTGGRLDAYFVASSIDTELALANRGFKVLDLTGVTRIDIYIDSADEVDEKGRMIKGGGAAHTLEKILAYASRFNVFIVDYTKIVRRLGERNPLPVEVLPYATSIVLEKIKAMGLEAQVRTLRKHKYGPVISDTGGVVLDVTIPEGRDAGEIAAMVEKIPGVVSTGFFEGYIDLLIVGYPDRVEEKMFTREKRFT